MNISKLNIIKYLFLYLWLSSSLEAITSEQVFIKHPNHYFIETGSLYGDGIQMALKVGFPRIFSIELSPYFYQFCCHRFAHCLDRVHLLHGDSTTLLPWLLTYIDAPATFWLDGHYSWGNTARGDTNTPILAELEAIARHPIKTHTILIDDVRQFGTIEFDFIELSDIVNKLKEINPNYVIYFEDGLIANDVLVAKIPNH